jgi:hypothetical protein
MSLPRTLTLAVVLCGGAAGHAAAQNPAARETSLTGTVRSVSGAEMQGVSVRVFEPDGTSAIRETATDARGNFVVALPAGRYRVEISAPEFTSFVEQVTVPRNALNVVLQLLPIELAVDVSAANELVAGMSLTSTTISGDDLLDLPRNEEDLARYLMELAGADVTGNVESDVLANFIVDGFSDGRLPRPDQIAEIIVDPSPMSADGRGGPRIEIVTRPGTGRWQRSVDLGFADESLNARTPGERRKEPRQTRDIGLEIGGPVIPNRLDMTFEVSSETDERAGNSLHAITSSGQVFQGVVQPQREREIQVRAQLALNPRHRLDVRLTGGSEQSDNAGVGGFTLPERGSDDHSTHWTLQVVERMSRPNLTNNARIQIERTTASVIPLREGFAINVADAFDGGGGTSHSNNQEVSFRVDDTLRLQRGTWNFELGGALQYGHERNVDQDNYNGTFEFASLHDYCLATGLIGASCADTGRVVAAARAGGVAPTYLDARGREAEITGVPVTFTQAFGNAELEFSEVGFNMYAQADRRFGRTASLRLGLRYEGTNHSRDFLRVNPTANFQYRLTPGTLVSAGGQLSFADFTDYERLLRNDGSTYETELFISSPSFPDPFAGGTVVIGAQTRSLWTLDPVYRPPYTFSRQLSVTQEIPGDVRLTLSYDSRRGVHQRRARNINAPYPGTPLPEEVLDLDSAERQDVIDRMRPLYPYVGNITQIESTGLSAGRTVRVRVQRQGNLELFGVGLSGMLNYVRRDAEDDNDFNNPYVRTWGPTRRDHEISSQFRITLPRDSASASPLRRAIARATYGGAIFNFNLRAYTGRLYSVLSGSDLNGDQSSRDRLPGAARNGEVGPGSWNLDMTLTKDYALSGSSAAAGGGGRGEAGPGGQGGRGGRARQPEGPRIRFQARVYNLLNRTHPRGYGSVVTSPLFGLPTGYTTGRTVNLSMSLDF